MDLEKLTEISDKELQARLRNMRRGLAESKRDAARIRAKLAPVQAVIKKFESLLATLNGERDRRTQAFYERIHEEDKRQRTFEMQLNEIAAAINHKYPEELYGDIPSAVNRIFKRITSVTAVVRDPSAEPVPKVQ